MDAELLSLTDARYVEDEYRAWKQDPDSVDAAWDAYFEQFDANRLDQWAAAHLRRSTGSGRVASPAMAESGRSAEAELVYKQSRVDSLLWAYRDVGYIYAQINPLKDYTTPELRYMFLTMEGNYETLNLQAFGLEEADLDTEFHAGRYLRPSPAPLRDILAQMRQIYCSTMGVEILHIQNRPMRRWLIERLESPEQRKQWTNAQKQRIQKDLIKAEEFERFVNATYIGQKRFSLEGGESLIPAVRYIIDTAPSLGIKEVVVGMAHRGRLNVFTNALRKPAVETFAQFEDNYKPYTYGGSGDVKYHLGHSFDVKMADGNLVHVSLVANPSHLESVDPVVEGKTRGIQRRRGDTNRKKVLPILIHGDAAFSGQGVVSETFNLSQLRGYRTGGTVHIIVNNQIGFTTSSRDARSTFFCTDVAKSMPVPILHVNGDDPEAVVRAVDLALRYRHKFGYDAVVDIQCYRRLGHNEADEPSFTHPLMYEMIKNHPSVTQLYGERVAREGDYPEQDQRSFKDKYVSVLKDEVRKARDGQKPDVNDAFEQGEWRDFTREYGFDPVTTGVPTETLQRIATTLTFVPEGFGLHPKLKRFVSDRASRWESGDQIDWAFGESLAWGSLLLDGYPIRLSGEDSGRGTFSQRHAVWWDVSSATPKTYTPLQHVREDQASFSVYDSPLSEYAVLGFDYGYSLAQPNILVMWEAQFGDFVNGAQVIIDQFIAAGESKWFRSSGLVMLLPHGFEGQGPEHSSAHLERFLQLCADDNMQVCAPSTPAQYFHLLRRQMHQRFRKPLIVMTPKSLLRTKACVSAGDEFASGGFQTVIDDPGRPHDAQTVLLCSGKVYYDLVARQTELDPTDTAVIRVEQLYPFHTDRLRQVLAQYPKASQVRWVQEESENRGGWRHVRDYLAEVAEGRPVSYVGRPASPSPATGSHRQHQEELQLFLSAAFDQETT